MFTYFGRCLGGGLWDTWDNFGMARTVANFPTALETLMASVMDPDAYQDELEYLNHPGTIKPFNMNARVLGDRIVALNRMMRAMVARFRRCTSI